MLFSCALTLYVIGDAMGEDSREEEAVSHSRIYRVQKNGSGLRDVSAMRSMLSRFYSVLNYEVYVANWVHASLAGSICVRASTLRH